MNIYDFKTFPSMKKMNIGIDSKVKNVENRSEFVLGKCAL